MNGERERERYLATGFVGDILGALRIAGLEELGNVLVHDLGKEDLAKLRSVLAMWSVQHARDTAWTNAEILWQIRDIRQVRYQFLLAIDRLTGFAGRGLLIPVL